MNRIVSIQRSLQEDGTHSIVITVLLTDGRRIVRQVNSPPESASAARDALIAEMLSMH